MKRSRAQAGLYSGNRKRKRKRVYRAPRKVRPSLNRRTGGFMGIKTKFFDTALTPTAIVSPTNAAGGEVDPNVGGSANFGCLGVPLIGTAESNRIGDEILVKQIDINGTVTCVAQSAQTSSDIGTKVFLALVLDTQTNGAQLNSEDVYTNPSADASLAASPFRDMQYTKRFKTIRTEELIFDNAAISYDGVNVLQSGLIKHFRWVIPVDVVQQMTGSQVDVSNISTNSFHMIAYASSTALAPTLQYNCRKRFIDQ